MKEKASDDTQVHCTSAVTGKKSEVRSAYFKPHTVCLTAQGARTRGPEQCQLKRTSYYVGLDCITGAA